jgi:murein DD-endopeptidase MepM/ murein hydrolase activator NlpD
MPGGLLSGYRADTGLDIAGFRMPVHAIAAGTLDYAEAGHTRWTSKSDSPFTLRLRLDTPIPWGDKKITHAYYGHLSALVAEVREGQTPAVHVEAGQVLGTSGWANGSPHLHLGLILDDHVDQDRWEFLLDESEVRAALQTGPNGRRLPRSS